MSTLPDWTAPRTCVALTPWRRSRRLLKGSTRMAASEQSRPLDAEFFMRE